MAGFHHMLFNIPMASASADANFGWFGGGQAPSTTSVVDRISYVTDTSSASSRGPLSAARHYLSATGNSDFGWFCGGDLSPGTHSTVQRIDYAMDTNTASVRGQLSSVRRSTSATGNINFGWVAGGIVTSGNLFRSTVDRIDYSVDTAVASIRGSLTNTSINSGATGNLNFGWVAGGTTPARVSTINRISYGSDLTTTSIRGPLTVARQGIGAAGNENYGWVVGGRVDFNAPMSTVERIDYASDTSVAATRGLLNVARNLSAGTGNVNFGWFGGGSSTPSVVFTSSVSRIDYTTDTNTASARGNMTISKFVHAATGGFPG
jgi:hypothetical protein